MAFAPLILKGNLKINATDVSAQVTSFVFKGVRDSVQVPTTFGARATVKGGADTYSADVNYLQDIDATAALSMIFWDALADATGTIVIAGSLKPGIVSVTNPLFTATALVTGVDLGGQINTIGVATASFPLTDRPVKTTT